MIVSSVVFVIVQVLVNVSGLNRCFFCFFRVKIGINDNVIISRLINNVGFILIDVLVIICQCVLLFSVVLGCWCCYFFSCLCVFLIMMIVVLIIVLMVIVMLFNDIILVFSFWKCMIIKVIYNFSGNEIIVISVECICQRNSVQIIVIIINFFSNLLLRLLMVWLMSWL